MKKKQYKVKIENGNIIPLESIDTSESREGIIFFLIRMNLLVTNQSLCGKLLTKS